MLLSHPAAAWRVSNRITIRCRALGRSQDGSSVSGEFAMGRRVVSFESLSGMKRAVLGGRPLGWSMQICRYWKCRLHKSKLRDK